ncbi:MAG TPA: DUF2530 domain-containing protein [Actinomycetales bacterium]|nr:DUF2530 domain-containing protein [Actinomycetales bacterium]
MPVYLPPEERREDPTPLRTDDRRTVLVGTAVWLALLVGTLVSRDGLVDTGRGWWTWSCLAGVALGLLGLAYLHHRETTQHRDVSRR